MTHTIIFSQPSSDYDIIQLSIANFINDLIGWFSCYSISLNNAKTDSTNLSIYIECGIPLSSITLTHAFLLFLPISNSITTL